MPDFSHLHVHSQYSLLDGAASVNALVKKAVADNQKAVAITDHGNMFGAFNFVAEATKNNIKPVVGCEFYVVHDRHKKSFDKENKDIRYHQLLLAKNEEGYKNLAKLCSLGYIEGLYSKWPRVDKELILKYHEGLIATSCCIGAEIPQTILHKGEEEAEKLLIWWLDIFGEDFYIELQRHDLKNIDNTGISQEDVNQVLLKFAAKHNVKVIATNDSHYIDREDFEAHDILLCVNTGEFLSKPIGNGKNFRFGFPNDQFYFKTQEEMNKLFSDIPEAIDNTNHIIDKINTPKLSRDILLPNFDLPAGFTSMDDFLHHITFEGAGKRYGEITAEIEERLNFELHVIKTMGFAGYFLIVADFIEAGRNSGVAVGPGRGSAAGSAVAYCIGITNIDPIKYSLLFERFLNPERVSMPDIDIDFDDANREKVIDYVVKKYGKTQVAQIITFGTMAAKSSIKDVARVMELPLPESNMLAKLVPDRPGISLDRVINAPLNGEKSLATKEGLSSDEIERARQLRAIASGNDLKARVLKKALQLEGSVRNTGIHAAGVIIAPDDITNYIPVSTSKETDLYITQFDGKIIESAGMLKMDFLGLKTLSIIGDAINNVKETKGIVIDIDTIPLDDTPTFELYQRGDTIGTFQFESDGMRTYLRQLKPTDIEDLIAMNALYRPGPMDFIPTFINRKQGREKVVFPHPLLEEILAPTYGIMVYQEQIMQTAQIIGGFSLGKADILRRAMGKKKLDEMQKMKAEFVEGAKTKDIDEAKASEIFEVMEKFASYGFNRSHSAAYSVVAYQTAYLKSNYPSEYMAAVLAHNMQDIKKINFFIDECKRMNVRVLGPDLNESAYRFSVNKKGELRFGLGAVKGVGEAAVNEIIEERKKNGLYNDVYDFISRVNLRAVNKKCIESLSWTGAFDCFENIHRSRLLVPDPKDNITAIDKLIKYGNQAKSVAQSAVQTLFGEAMVSDLSQPEIPECEPFPTIHLLQKEKEMLGFYVSGHPLDEFRLEMENICTTTINKLQNMKDQQVIFGGIVTLCAERESKGGRKFITFTIEDFDEKTEMALFSENYLKWRHLIEAGQMLLIKGKMRSRYNAPDELEVEVQEILLLSDAREKMANNFNIKFPLEKVNKEFINHLRGTLKEHPGKFQLNVEVYDNNEKLSFNAAANKFKVDASNELVKKLEQINDISVTLR